MLRLTREQLLTPISMRCARCGSEATAYPYPEGRGSLVCPRCTPRWAAEFIQWASARMLTDEG